MLWERCSQPISDQSRSYHSGDVPKNTIWGSFGPLGPSRGIYRPNRTAKSRNKSCIGQIGAFWKCVLVSGANKPFQRLYNSKNSKKTVFYSKITVFLNKKPLFFSKKTFFCPSSQSAHRHRRDEHIMLPTRSACKKPEHIMLQKTVLFSSFLFEFYHSVPIATGRRNILCCRRGAPQAH